MQAIARSPFFENSTIAIVIINAVFIGIESDWNKESNLYESHWAFQVLSQFFGVYFTCELVIRFLAFEHKVNCLNDGWFKFDLFLVSTMILDMWLLMPILYFAAGDGVKIPTQPFRILRLGKLSRMARLMRVFPELVTMLKGLAMALRAVGGSFVLLGLLTYVFAIVIHTIMKDEEDFNKEMWDSMQLSFDSMGKCMFSLTVAGTFMLDGAVALLAELIFSDNAFHVLAGVFVIIFSLLTAMCIINMLIGVLCDVFAKIAQEQRNSVAIGLVRQELLGELRKRDVDNNGRISHNELMSVMSTPSSKAVLKKLHINRRFLLELQKSMYTRPNMTVPIKDIVEMMMKCRGDSVTTVDSIAGTMLTVLRELSFVKMCLHRDVVPSLRNQVPTVTHPRAYSRGALMHEVVREFTV